MRVLLNPERLLLCRQHLGLTQQEAAESVGVSQPAYQRYEAGTRNPSIQVVRQIAAAFHTSVEYLTGESSDAEPDYIVIDKKSDPQLFSLVERFRQNDNELLRNQLCSTCMEQPQPDSENECYTYFDIIGDFDPNEITARLGITPHESWKAGDHRRVGQGVYAFSRWACGLCDEYDVMAENQMRKTVASLLDKVETLNQIRNNYEVRFSLEVVPTIRLGNATPVLSPPLDIIDFCCATRTKIDIDYYITD